MSNPLSSKTVSAIVSDDEMALNEIELLLAGDDFEETEKSIDEPSEKFEDLLESKMEVADADFEEIVEEEPKKKAKAAKPKEAKSDEEKKPRISTAGLKPEESLRKRYGADVYQIVVLEESDVDLDEKALKKTIDERLKGFDESAKKVGEKVVNFFQAVNGEAKISVYTDIALKLLVKKKEISVSDIKQAYLDQSYKVGTASAQSSQMSQLLPLLKVATRAGSTLTVNESSPLLQLLLKEK